MSVIRCAEAYNLAPRLTTPEADLYGKSLTTDFLERIRPDARFDSLDELIAQVRDILLRE